MEGSESNRGNWQVHSAADYTHSRVMEIIRSHLPVLEGKKVCDLPCGAGALSARMAEAGMKVTPVDLEKTEPFQYDPTLIVLADANLKLPFEDGEFDAVVSVEGIEHLENPSHFLRECARLLSSGGLLFLSTPNVDSYHSRRSVFAHGYHRFFMPVDPAHKMASHLLPVDMTFVRGAAERAGLSVIDVGVNRLSGKNWWRELLRPLFTRKLPNEMKGQVPFYGDVIIYVLRKG
ncbi:MAG: class I SAM-dependent methyltransferase [Gammaproteobacteria bacterium]|nr:class I SAM-dependent methyltransferase [Gammaproteobacteria bacterium]MBU1624795.1 class I SAM-dependent methyltransferase [Gammaproteobacteria bacterium]MBU1982639.1 class I SAM-dependent methyltransferase [Gammaproteobacteria bacterium]